jgi:hypothetical protein
VGQHEFAVYALTAFFGLQVVLAGSSFALGLPFLTYQPPYWRTLLIYGGGAAYVGCLCWWRSPRARFSAYIFLTVDVMRALRGTHWWTIVIDLAVLIVMQMPALRTAYPSIRAGGLRGRRARQTAPAPDSRRPLDHGGPREGVE